MTKKKANKLLSKFQQLVEEKERREKRQKLLKMYPDEGDFSRSNYPKHIEFFQQGVSQRLFIAANRCGKTTAGAYEIALHLTGLYPDWWREEDGFKRFDTPVKVWVAGDTNESTKAIIQLELFGEIEYLANKKKWVSGTGMIPYDQVKEIGGWKSGAKDLIDTAKIKHASGGMSEIGFKTYRQGRKIFQGTAQHVVWFDEECPKDVYSEALTRTATTEGIVFLTFTPLSGITQTVLTFLPDAKVEEYNNGIMAVVNMTWDHLPPHLTEEAKQKLLAGYDPHEKDARTKGVPSLDSGLVWPVPESNFVVKDFPIPKHWRKCYGLDVGWNFTGAVWLAINPETGVTFAYSEHKLEKVEPSVNASGIKSRGKWINGAIDPASRGRSPTDGNQLLQMYNDLGLRISPAKNAVSTGVSAVFQALRDGRLKIFESMQELLSEMRLYRRDKNGNIVKKDDHLCDALRYGYNTLDVAGEDPSDYDDDYRKNLHRRDNFDLNDLI